MANPRGPHREQCIAGASRALGRSDATRGLRNPWHVCHATECRRSRFWPERFLMLLEPTVVSCENETALGALRLGHVRWDQLHPEVRVRLEASGYHAGSFVDCEGRASHLRPLQHGERWPGRQR